MATILRQPPPTGNTDLNDGHRIRRGGFALADQVVASATNVLTGIIIGRACTEDEFGLYMLGFTLVLVAIRLQNSLIATPYMVFSPRLSAQENAAYTGSTLIHHFGLSLIGVLVLSSIALFLPLSSAPEGLSRVIWALVIANSFILFREYARQVSFANLCFDKVIILDLAVGVLQIGALLVLVKLNILSPSLVFLIMGSACVLPGILWLINWKNLAIPNRDFVLSRLKQNWIFGRWIFASALTWEMSVQVYPWCLTYFHGTAVTGSWAACIGAIGLANPLLLGIQNYIGPTISHALSSKTLKVFRKEVFKISNLFLMLVLPAALVLFILGGWIVSLLYGPKYAGNGTIVSVLAVNLLTLPFQNTLSRALIALERVRLEYLTNLVPLSLFVGLGWWLVEARGPLGAAWAMLISSIALGVAKYSIYRIVVKSRVSDQPGS